MSPGRTATSGDDAAASPDDTLECPASAPPPPRRLVLAPELPKSLAHGEAGDPLMLKCPRTGSAFYVDMDAPL